VFLLSDRDVERLRAAVERRLPLALRLGTQAPLPSREPVAPAVRWIGACGLGLWLTASALGASVHLSHAAQRTPALADIYALYEPFRVANVYHLFGHITRERIEPQLEVQASGRFREYDLYYKPGAVERRPPYVAPHQPRVDFRLWFYGLSFDRGMPRYVHTLLDRLCHDPEAVQPLFPATLPRAPDAVRISFYRYRFSSPEQRARTGAYWTRERLGALPARSCR
jgi:hypothetical protein